MEFLERLEKDPEGLTKVTIAEYAKLGGMEGAEVVMWLLMRGALSKKVKKLHQTYYLPSMTPISSVIFENDSVDPVTETDEQFRTRMTTSTTGIEKLEGTYPYTIERSVKAFRLNRFLHELIKPEFRKQFLADPEPLFEQHKLTAQERELVMKRDWRALIHYGVIFFLLEKFGAVVGTTNLHIYAAMRGQSLEDFQKTRNAQVLYSVAGNDDSKKTWDPPVAQGLSSGGSVVSSRSTRTSGGMRCVTPDCGSRLRALLSVLRPLPPTRRSRPGASARSSRTASQRLVCYDRIFQAGDSAAPAPRRGTSRGCCPHRVPAPAPARDAACSGRGRCACGRPCAG